jgi:hypothetical protein
MVFDKSCYSNCDRYSDWRVNLRGHQRVSLYALMEIDGDFGDKSSDNFEFNLSYIEYLNSQNKE